jgi:hypothetical protein
LEAPHGAGQQSRLRMGTHGGAEGSGRRSAGIRMETEPDPRRGGLEGRLFDNWTARIEYLYLDLGSVTSVPATAPNATVATAFNSRVTDNLVRLGVNYKFDPNTIWSYD